MPRRTSSDASLQALARELLRLERRLVDLEKEMRPSLIRVAPNRRESARNLVHYIALRHSDLRDLQSRLSQRGLSSLGRAESCVMGSLLEVSARAHESLALLGQSSARRELARLGRARGSTLSWETSNQRLRRHTRDILGPQPAGRHIYIMVTAPSAKEADRAWMVKMLEAGMNVLRVNCAHEGQPEWAETIRALRSARRGTGKKCRVLMDLAGPKIRTGPIAGARRVATWKPVKDDIGRVTAPARVVIRRASAPAEGGVGPLLLLNDHAFADLRAGDELRFRDARHKRRTLEIRDLSRDELLAHGNDRAYVLERVKARLFRRGRRMGDFTLEVGEASGAPIDVKVGDRLVLTRRATSGKPPQRDREGVAAPAIVTCTLPAALEHLATGHRVIFDDGRIHTVVQGGKKKRDEFLLRVVHTQKETVKLRAEKGINLPDTLVTVPSLTDEDRKALPFIAKHADAVSLSFVRRPEDIRMLHAALDRLGRRAIGVVLKIEKREAFENLPRLILEGLRRPPLAVMIARGDLAVEVGFERLAELQEEILWLCEAGHVPAIWATQVLDTLARAGFPSRAEVTDAAASVAAECVMLNKGPYIDEAVRVLSDILGRMEKHHYKKRSLFRKLRVSTFVAPPRRGSRRARITPKGPAPRVGSIDNGQSQGREGARERLQARVGHAQEGRLGAARRERMAQRAVQPQSGGPVGLRPAQEGAELHAVFGGARPERRAHAPHEHVVGARGRGGQTL
jgi:pyruvate kinase